MRAAQKAMIIKDVKEVLGSNQVLMPMIIVPLIMAVVIPTILLIGARYGVSGLNGMDAMLKLLKGNYANLTEAQVLIEIGLNYMFPVFFLLIPVMTSSVIGASSFVGEKERKTMESLLYTPISIRELFAAKVIGTAVPAYAVTLISALMFGIVMDIGGWVYFSKLIFPNIKWLILIFWVTPAITLLGINFMVLVSAKAKTYQDAQQMSALIVIPILLLLFGQMSGIFILSNILLLALGAIIYILDVILLKNVAARFVPEKLI